MDTVLEEAGNGSSPLINDNTNKNNEISIIVTPSTPIQNNAQGTQLTLHASQANNMFALAHHNNHHMSNHYNPDSMGSNVSSRRMTAEKDSLNDFVMVSRRPSAILNAFRRPSNAFMLQQKRMMEYFTGNSGSKTSLNFANGTNKVSSMADLSRRKNRRLGDDSLTTALSAFYAKLIVVLGFALPVTDILSIRAPASFYQGFYLYLYLGSVAFVGFMYVAHLRNRALFSMLTYHDKNGEKVSPLGPKKRGARYGSFYLRVGAIAFGIGSMVYSGLEFGQYFELKHEEGCSNVLVALTPATRMLLSIVQMQFIFLSSQEFEMERHKVISRFGLMHMIATNLCEWLYVLIEETKHEIFHITHNHKDAQIHGPALSVFSAINSTLINGTTHAVTKRATASEIVVDCRRTNIMGSLVQNASPFLFPCTIEYSLICAVILYEMWKEIKSVSNIQKSSRRNSRKPTAEPKNHHQLSVDCSRAHRGLFGGILIIVMTIIALIMYFVLIEEKSLQHMAILEVTITEIVMYLITSMAVIFVMIKMRDLKYSRKSVEHGIGLDCTLLLLAQTGVYIYCLFSIIGCHFSIHDDDPEDYASAQGLVAELFSLLQTSLQTIFILNAWWRRCKGKQQNRDKPGREIITFLLVANMAIWFINTLIKNRASFRPTHLAFFGTWAWTIITHVSMPLAIFYRFHSTICLFEIWKTAYKYKQNS